MKVDFSSLFSTIKNDYGNFTEHIERNFADHSALGSSYFETLLNFLSAYSHFDPAHKSNIQAYCQNRLTSLRTKETEETQRQGMQDRFLRLSITDLENIVKNFGKTQNEARIGIGVSGLAAIAAIIALFVEPCKCGSKPPEVQLRIDTSTYKSVLKSQQADRLRDSQSFYRIESYIDSLQRRIDSLEAHEKKK